MKVSTSPRSEYVLIEILWTRSYLSRCPNYFAYLSVEHSNLVATKRPDFDSIQRNIIVSKLGMIAMWSYLFIFSEENTYCNASEAPWSALFSSLFTTHLTLLDVDTQGFLQYTAIFGVGRHFYYFSQFARHCFNMASNISAQHEKSCGSYNRAWYLKFIV
jgi:hypothetical protein